MTTDTLSEDIVLQISPPHIIMAESGGGVGAGAGAGGRGVYSGGVELGRRLLLAARQGNTPLVLDLMAKGAPFTTDWLGTSPLHVAAAGGHVETCGVLLRAGVSRDARSKVERTPLHLAAHAGHAHVARLLLEHGARPDCRDMLRMTPLHWAAERGHRGVVRVLLRHAADVCALSKFHKSARQLAAARNHQDIVALIDEAVTRRENDKSLEALRDADEQMEIPAAEQLRALDSIERAQEPAAPPATRPSAEPIKIHFEKPPEGAEGGSAAQLLKKHGITLLPHDDTTTVLNAIQSGRTVVLSDAGKLMLKENSAVGPPAAAPPAAAGRPPPPPRAGVKIFTLNNKLVSLADNKLAAGKVQDMQIKLVNVGGGGGAARGAGKGARRPVKIIMQKANYNKIVGKPNDITMQAAPAPVPPAGAPGVVCVPEEFLSSTCPAYLRAQLLSAHHTINTLTHQLRHLQHLLHARGDPAPL